MSLVSDPKEHSADCKPKRDAVERNIKNRLRDRGLWIVGAASDAHDLEIVWRLEPGQHSAVRLKLSGWSGGTKIELFESEERFPPNDVWFPKVTDPLVDSALSSTAARRFFEQRQPHVAPREVVATPAPAPAPANPPSVVTPLTLQKGVVRPQSFALIVGIEKYRDAPAVNGARVDAQSFERLARDTLGVPTQNIRVAIDDRATRIDIAKHVAWLRQNVPQNGRVYFFFSGHGAPHAANGSAYLLPYDGDPSVVEETAVSLGQILAELSQSRARDVLAFVDSCFSGAGGRSVLPPGARPLVAVKAPRIAPRVALLSSATGSQIAGPGADGTSGLFTRQIVEALGTGRADGDGDGQISMAELLSWVKPRVVREAKRLNREQVPELTVGDTIPKPEDLVVSELAQ